MLFETSIWNDSSSQESLTTTVGTREKLTDQLAAAIDAFNENDAATFCPVERVIAIEEIARIRRELAALEKREGTR